MDKLSSVVAAVRAGKLPTQNQVHAAIDWTLENIIPSVESPDASKLSNPGKNFAHETQYLLTAYKKLWDNKNYDNLLQDVLWKLSERDFAEACVEPIGTEEAATVLQSICSEICSFLGILWTMISCKISDSAADMAVCPRICPKEIYHYICELAQDKDYHRTLSILLDTMLEWINEPLDTAADINQAPSLESFINDPFYSEEKHVLEALRGIRTLVERAADWPMVNIFAKAHLCTVHARNDRDLNRWINELFVHVQKGLDEPDYARSEEAQQMHRQLGERWELLVHQDSDTGRMFLDVWGLVVKLHAFQHGIMMDNDLQRVRLAHAAFGQSWVQSFGMGAQTGMQFTLDEASWFWQDVFNVYAPRILRVIKDIPIPGTEYVDNEIECVLENLNISSLSLLPGHGYMRNTTDSYMHNTTDGYVYITAPAGSQSTNTAFGTFMHIRMQEVQLVLDEVSFFYKDKFTIIGPKEFTGLMEFILPPKGIDIDLKFRLIPNTPEGLKEREHLGRFFKIERVEVTVAEDIAMRVQQSNQPIFRSAFKPVFMLRFSEALSRTLEEQIRGLFDAADALAFEIDGCSEEDAGLGGEKRELLAGRIPVGVGGAPEGAKTAVERVEQVGKEGLEQVQRFKQSIEQKTLEEKKRRGWQSPAFNL